jgi:hypothetical protein
MVIGFMVMLYDIKSHHLFSGVKEPTKESSLDGCQAAAQLIQTI